MEIMLNKIVTVSGLGKKQISVMVDFYKKINSVSIDIASSPAVNRVYDPVINDPIHIRYDGTPECIELLAGLNIPREDISQLNEGDTTITYSAVIWYRYCQEQAVLRQLACAESETPMSDNVEESCDIEYAEHK